MWRIYKGELAWVELRNEHDESMYGGPWAEWIFYRGGDDWGHECKTPDDCPGLALTDTEAAHERDKVEAEWYDVERDKATLDNEPEHWAQLRENAGE